MQARIDSRKSVVRRCWRECLVGYLTNLRLATTIGCVDRFVVRYRIAREVA